MRTKVTVFSGDNRIACRTHDTKELAEKDAASWQALSAHLEVIVEDEPTEYDRALGQ